MSAADDPEPVRDAPRPRTEPAWLQEFEDDLRARMGEREETPRRSWVAWLTARDAARTPKNER